ncbi:MAG TPA: flagellar assembly protein FliW [Bryobacteraceae bacterium]|nr:flagellar assembly protein FliW [Bryobacteraceae bacterium]
MSLFETKNFGRVSYDPVSVWEFPGGLPGFEGRRRFVALHNKESEPVIFLQSLEDPSLCFITMPVLAVDPRYRLRLAFEDLTTLGLPPAVQPRIGVEVMCLAVLSVRETGPTANLLAPVVLNLKNRRAVQAVVPESNYSHQHALIPQEAVVCS